MKEKVYPEPEAKDLLSPASKGLSAPIVNYITGSLEMLRALRASA
jgi:hypothetical protein